MKRRINLKKNNTVLIDEAITYQGEFVLAMVSTTGILHWEKFSCVIEMEEAAPDFIKKNLPECEVVITDCSLGYLPSVQRVISEKGCRQIFRNKSFALKGLAERHIKTLLNHLKYSCPPALSE